MQHACAFVARRCNSFEVRARVRVVHPSQNLASSGNQAMVVADSELWHLATTPGGYPWLRALCFSESRV